MSNVYRLYIFETLVREGGSMAINSLWSCVSSRFTPNAEFIQIIGKNVSDFELFLRANSSLFNVDGFIVSLADDDSATDFCIPETKVNRYRMDFKEIQMNDSNYEIEAVRYFKSFLMKRPDTPIPIRSLVTHLSQASMRVKIGLGTKNELIAFLYRFPRVFKIVGEFVTLADDSALMANVQLRSKKRVSVPLKERSSSMRISNASLGAYRVNNLSETFQMLENNLLLRTPVGRPLSTMIERTPAIAEPVINAYTGRKSNIISLTIPEFKTFAWLRSVMMANCFKNKDKLVLPINVIMRHLIEAPETVHSTVGTTQVEFIEFINKHTTLVNCENDMVHFLTNDKIHLIIVENQPQESNNGINLNGKKGCVFCVSKLWGIIDLGYHEHVFFDRSLFKNVTDLQKHFKVGELLYFNAVLATKESRAKWRATRVWKESDVLAARLAMKSSGALKKSPYGDCDVALSGASRRQSNMLIDALVLKQSPELTSALCIEGVNLSESINSFASVRLAAPWEVSAIIAQSNELFSEPDSGLLSKTSAKSAMDSSGYNSTSSNFEHLNGKNATNTKRRPLVEVHAINGKLTAASASNNNNNNVNSASSEDVHSQGTSASSISENGSTMSDLEARFNTAMNLDAEPIFPIDMKMAGERKNLRSSLLICAEQASQTENYRM